MSKIGLIIILSFTVGTSFAQNYFVFIGADNRQPFYVRLDSQFYSSSPEGHLILSQLRDSSYQIAIGFPGQSTPESRYSFSIHEKDQDFQLKSDADGSWKLFDVQGKNYVTLSGGGAVGDEFRSPGVKKDDAFSRMMAGVVHDTAVLYNTYALTPPPADSASVAKANTRADTMAVAAVPNSLPADTAHTTIATPPPSSDTLAAAIHSDTTRATAANIPRTVDTTAATPAPATPPVTLPLPATTASIPPTSPPTTTPDTTNLLYRPVAGNAAHKAAPKTDSTTTPLYRPTSVTKLSERKLQHGVRLVYADHSRGAKADTIVVIIPTDPPVSSSTPVTTTPGHQAHATDTTQPSRGHGPNPDSPTFSQSTATRPATTPPTETPRPHTDTLSHRQAKPLPYVNSDCHDFATDYDLDKLREKMLYLTKDEDRIAAARKTFKLKCFSTRQIRALCEVFTAEATKFRFLEAAWPFAADERFHELSNLLADPVYISKFKVLTHQ